MTEMFKSEYIATNGITLHCKIAGEGKTVILLHGFPDFWYTWRKIIPFLVEENYKVVAPDLRGYNKSDIPKDIKDYELDIFINDIVGLIQKTSNNNERVSIVGHDWGGAIAWRLAETHPELIEKLIIINCPHPQELKKALKRNFIQMLRSYYFAVFRIRGLADWFIYKYRRSFFKRLLQKNIYKTEPVPQEVLEEYVAAFSNKNNVTAAINYYRTAFIKKPNEFVDKTEKSTEIIPKITAPTMVIWGCEDKYLGRELVFNIDKYCLIKPEVIYIKDAGHWAHIEKWEQVNNYILRFLRRKHLTVDADLTKNLGFGMNTK